MNTTTLTSELTTVMTVLHQAHKATATAMRYTRSAEYLHAIQPTNNTLKTDLVNAQTAEGLAFQAYGSALYLACQSLGINYKAVTS